MTSTLDRLFDGQPPAMTVSAVAEVMGLSKQAVYKWLHDGVVPGYKVGSTWFILRDELKDTIREGRNLQAPMKEQR